MFRNFSLNVRILPQTLCFHPKLPVPASHRYFCILFSQFRPLLVTKVTTSCCRCAKAICIPHLHKYCDGCNNTVAALPGLAPQLPQPQQDLILERQQQYIEQLQEQLRSVMNMVSFFSEISHHSEGCFNCFNFFLFSPPYVLLTCFCKYFLAFLLLCLTGFGTVLR